MTNNYPNVKIAHKNECLKLLKSLNRNLKNAEKDKFSNVPNLKNDKDFENVYEINLTNELNIKHERLGLAQRIRQVSLMIKNFKEKSRSLKPCEKTIQSIKALMEEIDESIAKFKEEHRVKQEELAHDEKLLTKEVDNYEKKILSWSSANESNETEPRMGVEFTPKQNDCNLLTEVVEFDKFLLQNGGHCGGWEEIDHNLFIKIRNKHKGKKPAFMDELERLIATKNREQIEKHEEWFAKYSTLKELKKEAIRKWKESKINSKVEVVSLAEEEIKLNREIEKELRHRIEKQHQMEKQMRNKMLNEWRIEREIKKAKELETDRIREAKKQEKEIQQKIKQIVVKEKVEEYRKQKEELNEYIELEQFLEQEVEREVRQKQIKEEIENFQQRDFENVRMRREKLEAKEYEKEEKQKRLEKLKEPIEVVADRSRLYQPTSTWKNRLNTPRSESCGPIVTPRIPHLAIPSWRQAV